MGVIIIEEHPADVPGHSIAHLRMEICEINRFETGDALIYPHVRGFKYNPTFFLDPLRMDVRQMKLAVFRLRPKPRNFYAHQMREVLFFLIRAMTESNQIDTILDIIPSLTGQIDRDTRIISEPRI